jgi:hypothetical protein
MQDSSFDKLRTRESMKIKKCKRDGGIEKARLSSDSLNRKPARLNT